MSKTTDYSRALALRDLSDPAQGPHAMQQVVDILEAALATAWRVPVRRERGPRVMSVRDNYDRLRYRADDVTRARRYSRYVDDRRMLRSHTTAHIPGLLRELAEAAARPAEDPVDDVLLSVPGLCYRRDLIDRVHVGEPHQHDLWRIRPIGPALTEHDLRDMVATVVASLLPGHDWHTPPSGHPYTIEGREIYVGVGSTEVEVGECGLAHPEVLADAGLPDTASGLAMGLGLDRLLMLVKGVDDIRLLRSTDPRVAEQMLDLSAYRPVSTMPAARRDLSVAVADDLDGELLGDRVRQALGADAGHVEQVEVLSSTSYDDVPETARDRLGMRPGQRNVLLRVLLRDLQSTLTSAQANRLRDRIYAALHEGVPH